MNELITLGSREILGKTVSAFGAVENPLFDPAIVAEAIEYSKENISQMLANVDDDEKVLLEVPNVDSVQCTQSRNVGNLRRKKWFLTEAGLYEVLFLSRKPLAKAFKVEVKKLLHELRTGKSQISLCHQLESLQTRLQIAEMKLQVFEEHHPAKFYDYDETAALCSHYRKPPFGREHLKRWLVNRKILCKQAAKNEKPIQHYLNIGWFVPVIHEWYRRGRRHTENRYYITPKGLMGIIDMMIRDNMLHIPSTPQRVFPDIYLPHSQAPLAPEAGGVIRIEDYQGNEVAVEMATSPFDKKQEGGAS
jgi:prophage antirepressor-like protein